MPETQTYRVRHAGAIAQGGRFLEPGETVDLEPHVAASEFFGRLETLEGQVVERPVPTKAFAEALARARPHERPSLIAQRRAALEAELAALPAADEPADVTSESPEGA